MEPPKADTLHNEADVETNVLIPLLSTPKPHGLGFSPEQIRSKPNIRSLEICKRSNKKSYFPDFLILFRGIPVLAVEAKSPGENLETAAHEGRLYCSEINAQYPASLNPCSFFLVSDGENTELFSWDTNEPIASVSLPNLNPSDPNFQKIASTLDHKALELIATRTREKLSPSRTIRPLNRVGGNHAQSQQITPNEFGQMLVTLYAELFNPQRSHEREKIAKNAYVDSRKKERYVDEIERIVDQASPPSLNTKSLRKIEHTSKAVEITNEFQNPSNLLNRVLLLVGERGSGKSTFVDHLQYKIFPQKAESNLLWVRIDYNNAPSAKDELFAWSRAQIIKTMREKDPRLATWSLETLKILFDREIKQDTAYLKEIYGEQSTEYKTALAAKIESWLLDEIKLISCLEQFLCRNQRKTLVIVCDNCDKRDSETQLRVFEVVEWLKNEVRALIMLPLRESTYEINKNEPPLDTALKSLVYQITPPPFQKVLQKRIGLLLKEARDNPPQKASFSIGNAMVIFEGERIISFLHSLNNSLFSDKRLGKRLMQGLAAKNVRSGLEIFLDICRSGYLPEADLFYAEATNEHRPFRESVTYDLFMRGDRRYYSSENSRVKNLFQGNPTGRPAMQFLRYFICRWLRNRLGEIGPAGVKGFFLVTDILDGLRGLGYSDEEICVEIEHLSLHHIVLTEEQTVESQRVQLCSISPSGYIHLDLCNQFQYLARCAEDSYISDSAVAEKICYRLKNSLNWPRTLETAYDFAMYLDGQKCESQRIFISDIPAELSLPDFNAVADKAFELLKAYRSRR